MPADRLLISIAHRPFRVDKKPNNQRQKSNCWLFRSPPDGQIDIFSVNQITSTFLNSQEGDNEDSRQTNIATWLLHQKTFDCSNKRKHACYRVIYVSRWETRGRASRRTFDTDAFKSSWRWGRQFRYGKEGKWDENANYAWTKYGGRRKWKCRYSHE